MLVSGCHGIFKGGNSINWSCGSTEDDGSPMVECDVCQKWSQSQCIGLSEADATSATCSPDIIAILGTCSYQQFQEKRNAWWLRVTTGVSLSNWWEMGFPLLPTTHSHSDRFTGTSSTEQENPPSQSDSPVTSENIPMTTTNTLQDNTSQDKRSVRLPCSLNAELHGGGRLNQPHNTHLHQF